MNQFHSKCNNNSKTTTWIFHALCFALAMMHIDAEKNLTSTTGACVEKKVLKKWVPRSENNKFFTTNALVIYDTNYSHAHEKFGIHL